VTVEPRAVLAGPGAARALHVGGAGRLEVALGAAGYVLLGADGWLLLTGPRSALGPLSLLVAGLDSEPADADSRDAWVEPEVLVVGSRRIDLSGMRIARVPAWPSPARGADDALAAAAAAAGRLPAALLPGLQALERADLLRAVRLLAGRGEGLTPAGDDVLAGYAGWAAAARDPVAISALAAGRSSPIGHAYLRCAERGELPAAAAAVIAAALAGDPEAVARRARVLRRWGTSSGSAMLWGMAASGALSRRRSGGSEPWNDSSRSARGGPWPACP
jgi:hypothetical protein